MVFFNDTSTAEIYTLSLHDALPIFSCRSTPRRRRCRQFPVLRWGVAGATIGYSQELLRQAATSRFTTATFNSLQKRRRFEGRGVTRQPGPYRRRASHTFPQCLLTRARTPPGPG